MIIPHGFRGLGRDMALYGAMDAISRVTGLILLPLLTRAFSVDEYGAIDILTLLTVLVSALGRLALPSALARYFIESLERRELDRLASTLLACVAAFSLLLVLVGNLCADAIAATLLKDPAGARYVQLALLSAGAAAISSIPQMVLRMERRIARFSILNMLQSVLYAGLTIAFIFGLSTGLIGVFAALAISECARLVLALLWTRHCLNPQLVAAQASRGLRYSVPLLPAVLVTYVNRSADRFLLLAFMGLQGVSVFAAAARISLLVNVITVIFRQAWSPYAMSMIHANRDERNAFYRRGLSYYAGVFACLGLGLTAIGPEVLAIVVPSEYHHGYVVLPWLVGAAILHASGNITNLGVLISGHTGMSSVAAWMGGLTNIVLGVLLIPMLGIRGAAIGTFVGELIFTATLCYYTQQRSDIRFRTAPLLTVLSCYVGASIALVLLAARIESPIASLGSRALVLGVATALIAALSLDRPAWAALRRSFAVLGRR